MHAYKLLAAGIGTLLLGLAAATLASAAEPTPSQIKVGANCAECTVDAIARLNLPYSKVEAYSAKLSSAAGRRSLVTLLGDGGTRTSPAQLLEIEARARFEILGKLSPKLHELTKHLRPSDPVKVTIWSSAKIEHPPKEGLLASTRTLTTHQTANSRVLHAAALPITSWLKVRGYAVVQDGTQSPMISTTIKRGDLTALSRLPEVIEIDYDDPGRPASTAWFGTIKAPQARNLSTGGTRRACVIEGGRPPNTTFLRVAGTASPAGYVDWHIQATAGIISNTFGNGTSVTNTPNIFIGNWDQFPGDIFQWCATQNARVINFSWSVAHPDSGATTLHDRKVDYYARIAPFPLIVSGAGNGGNYVENKSFNGLQVGASNDQGTTSVAGDTIAGFSAWKNPTFGFGDYELPHIVAPGINVDSADITNIDGTSFATPMVSGAALLALNRDAATFNNWPEMLKSVLIATAVRNVDGGVQTRLTHSGSPDLVDGKDGAGLLDAFKAVDLAAAANYRASGAPAAAKGRFRKTLDFSAHFDSSGNGLDVWRLTAPTAGRMRVVITWGATSTCGTNPNECTAHEPDGDIDLLVGRTSSPAGNVCFSNSNDSTWEICDFAVTAGQAFTARPIRWSNRTPTTPFSIAWYRY